MDVPEPGMVKLAAAAGQRADAAKVIMRWPLEKQRARIDDEMAAAVAHQRATGRPISCRGAGCFGCCRADVTVTTEEVERLLPYDRHDIGRSS